VKVIYSLNRWLGYLAVTVLALMMLLTVVDVTGRYFSRWFDWASPISGTTEICKLMMVIIVFPALGWAALGRVHVKVDLLMTRLPPRVQAIVNAFTLLIALGTYVIITWRSFLESAVVNRQTSLLELPFTPFYWIMSVGFAIFCVAIIVLIIENITKAVKK
jgi:TRAP-type C4-dicarboxylate transport system permease small subunit